MLRVRDHSLLDERVLMFSLAGGKVGLYAKELDWCWGSEEAGRGSRVASLVERVVMEA